MEEKPYSPAGLKRREVKEVAKKWFSPAALSRREAKKAAETVWREGRAMAVNRKELMPEEPVEMEIPTEEEVESTPEETVEILTEEIPAEEAVGKRWELREAVGEATVEESLMAGE